MTTSFWEQACIDRTGKTVAEWEQVWTLRRIKAFRDRKLNGTQLYSVLDRETAIRFYDLGAGDFDATVDENDMPMSAATGTLTPFETKAMPDLSRVTRYRVRQDALRRIAEESRRT